jgi:transposase-like protein
MNLTDPIFTDADAARAHLEKLQWAHGRVCPHCGTVDNSVALKGKSTRPGVYKCRDCRKPFSVTVGTLFERSHVPLNKWLLAVHLLCSSKKGMSSHQLMRSLGVTYKTAWFMSHRIRESMQDDGSPMGGPGKTLEVDETFIGASPERFVNGKGWQNVQGTGGKRKVVTLVERGGRARSIKVDSLKLPEIYRALENADRASILQTDEAQHYRRIGVQFADHQAVEHGKGEYGRGDVHTNTVEGFYSIFKRGMRGIYQHCGEQHLFRYLREFDFRYSNRAALGISDTMRAEIALAGIVGKRLTYRRSNGLQAA